VPYGRNLKNKDLTQQKIDQTINIITFETDHCYPQVE